jgi:hypothetical protein
VKKYDGRNEENPKPALVASSALRVVCADADQEVVQKEATADEIAFGWTCTVLEPDW